MSRNRWSGLAVVGAALVVAGLLGPGHGRAPAPKPKLKPKETQRRQIPLKSIYTTSAQEELNQERIPSDRPEVHRDLEAVREKMTERDGDSPLVFMVAGKDFPAALRATCLGLTGAPKFDEPVEVDPRKRAGEYWSVVFLGIRHSAPPAWLVESVEQEGCTVTVRYSEPFSPVNSADSDPYLLWIPLGKLKKGSITLQLYHADKKRVQLSRRVRVGG